MEICASIVDAAPNLFVTDTIKQPDDQPIGIDLPIGFKGKLAHSRSAPTCRSGSTQAEDLPTWTRGLADREHTTMITRSGSKQNTTLGLQNTTLGRLGAESLTMD